MVNITPIHVALNVVVVGPIYNGVAEHPAIVTRVYGEDPVTGAIRINATMFPDGGGEPQYQPNVMLFAGRQEALHNLGKFRTAYAPSLQPPPAVTVFPPAAVVATSPAQAKTNTLHLKRK